MHVCPDCGRAVPVNGDERHEVLFLPLDADPETCEFTLVCRVVTGERAAEMVH